PAQGVPQARREVAYAAREPFAGLVRAPTIGVVTDSAFAMSGKIASVDVQAAHSNSLIAVDPPAASERAASGRAARSECPRSSLSALPIADDRDPIGLL